MAEIEQQSDDQRMAAVVLTAACDSAINRFAESDRRQLTRMFPLVERWRLRPGRATGVPVHTDAQPRIDIQSDAFKEWFAGSVMVKADGQPRSFWHGTFRDFDSFDDDPATRPAHRQKRAGLYFTAAHDYACCYGYNVLEVCLKVRRPYVTFDYEEACHPTAADIARHVRGGYDAIAFSLLKDPNDIDEICVFSPDQVRLIRRKHIGGLEPHETP